MTGGIAVAGPATALPDIRVGYGFDEGAGTTVADASSGNTAATAGSPTWTAAGRFGNAIVFDGSATRVRSNADVDLGTAFTLEAWVLNPAASGGTETIATVGPERDLYVNNGNLGFYTGSANLTFGALPSGGFQHVAVVADGTTVQAFLDGAPLGAAQNAAMPAVSAPLQIGAWINGSGASDFFSGTLDEVRVYNRALTAAEIGTDRTTPVAVDGGAGTGDTSPPVLSDGQPSGELAAGTTQTTLRVTTSEAATCRYSTTPNTAFAAMTTTFATTGGTAHGTPFTGLTNGANPTVNVRCRDAAGNAGAADFPITFSVATAGGGGTGAWSSGTGLPQPRSGNGAVSGNGFLYVIGGIDGSNTVTSTVYFARANANGTVGTWGTTTPVPIRSIRPVFYNGYIYLTGGTSDGGTLFATVYYAPVRSDGTLGAWATTTALPQAQISHTTFATNGFLYVVGGSVGPTCVTTVRYAPINANGTIGAWTTTSALPEARCGIVSAGAVSNGFLYVVGGFNNSDLTNRIFYARINANGSLAAWQTNATNLANAREYLYAEAAGGALYAIGGQGGIAGGVLASVERATINADGSVGAFSAGPALPAPRGYPGGARSGDTTYVLGGGTETSGGNPQAGVYAAQLGGAGSTPTAGLRVGYAFQEGRGTSIDDVSPSNTNGTATSPGWTTAGRFGNAITFNGITSRVRSTGSVSLTGAFTLEAWVRNPSNQLLEGLVTVGSERSLYLAGGRLRFFTGSTTLSFGTVATNAWQHVALVSDGTTARAYVEGVPSGTTQNVRLGNESGPLQIGSWIFGPFNPYDFSGTMDEVRVYNRALTAAEIATDRTTPLAAAS